MAKIFRFLSEAVGNFSRTGALVPSSTNLARAIAKQAIFAAPDGIPFIEFGPGTGVVTRYLLRRQVLAVEIDTVFVNILKKSFPTLKVIQQSAESFLPGLEKPVAIVSSIPMIGNPDAPALISALRAAREKGNIKQITTYTYGLNSPLDGVGFKNCWNCGRVWFNLPPATIWHYED